ncbi:MULTISPECIES: hemerythrin domain-containing protein [Streptomyces]|uniref:Hemerythrin domain-containing protein n=1 Tax=Streptomyces yangpuensis TaxID=1648182 RepID=A0ABY5Q4B4_9ACTN|nr:MULTISPECIES: hemerythrin domain-containing protein [Streptomyces]MBZ9599714.1 hemerythrin domain-containing protein [Streptomyces erythrochromogenes]UUY51281.1 hemerythrin domain-containing protein [Streptomyces yangpuensis]
MAHPVDVISELTADHREMDETFDIITQAVPAADRRTAAERLTVELVRHTVAEEQHLFPVVRAVFPDGNLIADREIADHARMEKILKDLEGLDADRPDFDRLVAALRAEVTAHVWEEEENLFPRLREACAQEALETMGDRIRRAKMLAPSPPDTPPATVPLAPGLGLVDRARDLVTGGGGGR